MKIGYWFILGGIIFSTSLLLPVSVIRSLLAIIGFIIAVASVYIWLGRSCGDIKLRQSKQEDQR